MPIRAGMTTGAEDGQKEAFGNRLNKRHFGLKSCGLEAVVRFGAIICNDWLVPVIHRRRRLWPTMADC